MIKPLLKKHYIKNDQNFSLCILIGNSCVPVQNQHFWSYLTKKAIKKIFQQILVKQYYDMEKVVFKSIIHGKSSFQKEENNFFKVFKLLFFRLTVFFLT